MTSLHAIFQKGPALIAPVVLGDPDLAATYDLIAVLARAGADAIELHIPFSDPTAEGEVFQKGALRALSQGTTVQSALALTARASEAGIPIVLKSYANVVYIYGASSFAADAAAAGACALYLFDVPLEEREEFAPFCKQQGLELLCAISTASPARVPLVCGQAGGYLRCECAPGEEEAALLELAARAASHCGVPIVLEPGRCTPAFAAKAARLGQGVSLGDGVAALVNEHGAAAIPLAAAYTEHIKAAMRGL